MLFFLVAYRLTFASYKMNVLNWLSCAQCLFNKLHAYYDVVVRNRTATSVLQEIYRLSLPITAGKNFDLC